MFAQSTVAFFFLWATQEFISEMLCKMLQFDVKAEKFLYGVYVGFLVRNEITNFLCCSSAISCASSIQMKDYLV